MISAQSTSHPRVATSQNNDSSGDRLLGDPLLGEAFLLLETLDFMKTNYFGMFLFLTFMYVRNDKTNN